MTYATKAIYKLLLTDYVKVSKVSVEDMLFDEQDINRSMDKIEVCCFLLILILFADFLVKFLKCDQMLNLKYCGVVFGRGVLLNWFDLICALHSKKAKNYPVNSFFYSLDIILKFMLKG